MAELLFLNASQVVTCEGPARARRGGEMNDAGIRTGVGVAVTGNAIAAVASREELERSYPDAAIVDCGGGVLSPGLVDSHTHAIFGRARYEEQELRASGIGYMEIARRGGGIHASVADLRARSEEELCELARGRIMRLASYGSTTIEVKSGYGLSLEDGSSPCAWSRASRLICRFDSSPRGWGRMKFRSSTVNPTRVAATICICWWTRCCQ